MSEQVSQQPVPVAPVLVPKIKGEGPIQKMYEKAKKAPASAKLLVGLALCWAGMKAKDEFFDKPAARAAAENKALSPEEAAGKVGQTVTVEFVPDGGKAFGNKFTLLNKGQYPDQTFTVQVKGPDHTSLIGRKIRATGVVGLYRGKPQLTCGPDDVK